MLQGETVSIAEVRWIERAIDDVQSNDGTEGFVALACIAVVAVPVSRGLTGVGGGSGVDSKAAFGDGLIPRLIGRSKDGDVLKAFDLVQQPALIERL